MNCVVVDTVTVVIVREVDMVCVQVQVAIPCTTLMTGLVYVVRKRPVLLMVVLE